MNALHLFFYKDENLEIRKNEEQRKMWATEFLRKWRHLPGTTSRSLKREACEGVLYSVAASSSPACYLYRKVDEGKIIFVKDELGASVNQRNRGDYNLTSSFRWQTPKAKTPS